jgi:hypothetical protein
VTAEQTRASRDAFLAAADALVAAAQVMYPGATNGAIQSACQCAITLANGATTIAPPK